MASLIPEIFFVSELPIETGTHNCDKPVSKYVGNEEMRTLVGVCAKQLIEIIVTESIKSIE